MNKVVLGMCAGLLVILGFGCDDETYNSELAVNIIAQPQGGNYITTLSCTYTAVYGEEAKTPPGEGNPIDLDVYWKNSEGTHQHEKVTFSEGGYTDGTFTTSFSATAGMYFDKTFWVELDWDDWTGHHIVKSDQAVCTVP